MKVLVTGGTGFIGSHTVVELYKAGHEAVIVDNLSNSKLEVLNRLEKLVGKKIKFYQLDVCDKEKLEVAFKENKIDAVIHFAGLKAVGESVRKPLEYYRNNIDSTLTLLEVMKENGVNNIIFSSSATVYGTTICGPKGFKETDKTGGTTNPYGTTKLFIEQILTDATVANKDLNVVLLRYFNPIGAHESGLLGEDPNGIPNNLMPYVSQVAIKKLPLLHVFGDDYDTKDGTGVRDYIHVIDLAIGHVLALKKFKEHFGVAVYNLGRGQGVSVLELVHAFEDANNMKIPYEISPRRPGDIATCFANVDKAKEELGFVATHSISDACRDSWNFQKNNPDGIK